MTGDEVIYLVRRDSRIVPFNVYGHPLGVEADDGNAFAHTHLTLDVRLWTFRGHNYKIQALIIP